MTTSTQRWRALAACAGMGADLFFDDDPATVAQAKAICAACVVRDECGDFARSGRESHGVWGGLSTDERSPARTTAQRGPTPCVDDDDLQRIFANARRDIAALRTLQTARPIGAQTAYKYLRRARELGLIEARGRTLYPRR